MQLIGYVKVLQIHYNRLDIMVNLRDITYDKLFVAVVWSEVIAEAISDIIEIADDKCLIFFYT